MPQRRKNLLEQIMFFTRPRHCLGPLWNDHNLKISALEILQLKTGINIKNRKFFVADYTKRKGSLIQTNYFGELVLSDKCNHISKISIVHNGNVIFDDFELAKTFKNLFDNAVDDLRIKKHENNLVLIKHLEILLIVLYS